MSLQLLEEFIQTGNTEGLGNLLQTNPDLATAHTSQHVSPLMLSCYYRKTAISNLLLNFIKNPDIYESASVGKLDSIANLVYNHPEQINSYSDNGFTPLGLAVYFGNEEIARYLLLKGADVNKCSDNGFNVYPIHSSVAADNADITKILLEAGADVNVVQKSGITPLHSAATNGNIELLILLLEAGASIHARMEGGKLPADLAYEKGFVDISRILKD